MEDKKPTVIVGSGSVGKRAADLLLASVMMDIMAREPRPLIDEPVAIKPTHSLPKISYANLLKPTTDCRRQTTLKGKEYKKRKVANRIKKQSRKKNR